jgi:hypothetical protein
MRLALMRAVPWSRSGGSVRLSLVIGSISPTRSHHVVTGGSSRRSRVGRQSPAHRFGARPGRSCFLIAEGSRAASIARRHLGIS